MRTGRPVIKRSTKALNRDIATLKRLRRSIAKDPTLDAGRTASLLDTLDTTILRLVELSLNGSQDASNV